MNEMSLTRLVLWLIYDHGRFTVEARTLTGYYYYILVYHGSRGTSGVVWRESWANGGGWWLTAGAAVREGLAFVRRLRRKGL